MKCWICYEKCNNICCDCKNDFRYGHNYCITKMILINKNYKCRFCNNYYIVNFIYKIIFYIFLCLKEAFDCKYYQGKRWIEDDDEYLEYDEFFNLR